MHERHRFVRLIGFWAGVVMLALSAAAPAALGDIPTVFETLKPFGFDFFAASKGEMTMAADAPVRPDYKLDNDDKIRVTYWAPSISEQTFVLTVNGNGLVVIPGIGEVRAAGYTREEFRAKLYNKLKEQLKNPSFQADLYETRTIVVFVTGAAKKPGRYLVKAESNLFNVIYAAGGPTEDGSLRRIALVSKDQKRITTDLYQFLLEGKTDRDIILHDQDTIFFPIAKSRVAILGQVARPALYEILDNTRVSAAMAMAGGLKASAYSRILRLTRVEAGKRTEQTLNAEAITADEKHTDNVTLLPGDELSVEDTSPLVRDKVSIRGNVSIPGDYSIRRTPTAKTLLIEAQLLVGSYWERADLVRVMDDGTPIIIPIPVKGLLDGQVEDIPLQDQDQITVYKNDEKAIVPLVSVEGAVKHPASFRLGNRMRVSDLLFAAGGTMRDAAPDVAHLYRRTGPNEFKIIRVSPTKAQMPGEGIGEPAIGRGEENPELQDEDRLVVYKQKDVSFRADKVRILGEVQRPGEFPALEGLTLYDLVLEAGGPTDMASGTVEVAVTAGEDVGGTKASVKTYQLADVMGGASRDEPVAAGALISLPKKGNKLTEPWRVELRGQFKRPGTYALLFESETLNSLIQRAGGFDENCDQFGISLTRKREQMLSNATSEQIKMVFNTMDQLLPPVNQKAMAATTPGNAQEPSVDVVNVPSPLSGMGSPASRSYGEALLLVSPRRLTGMPTGSRVSFGLEDKTSYIRRLGKVRLADGDIVEAPKLSQVVQVLGAVQSPGPVYYQPGQRTNDYIYKAGGGAPDADFRRAVVIKVSGAVQPLSRTKTVDPGDVIVVASKYQTVQPPRQRGIAETIADLLGVALVVRGLR